MLENQHSLGLVSQRSGSQCDSGERERKSSFEMSRVEEDGNGRRVLDWYQLKSPLPQINRTAQQHFNNRSAQQLSQSSNNPNPKNISNISSANQNNTSQSNISYKQRSLLSPGIQRQFSQIDQFLKQTYEKYGIYQLIKQFVDMQDQLVSTFEYLKKLQVMKNIREQEERLNDGYRKRVSCFEEINQVDEFSFQAQENIIHEFLYNLHQFFAPQVGLNDDDENVNANVEKKITQKQQQSHKYHQSSSQSAADYSFSQQKPYYQNMNLYQDNNTNFINTITKKNAHIHTSRSKHVVINGNYNKLRSKRSGRNVFTDEKMIQSIKIDCVGGENNTHNKNSNLINQSILPLKFQQPFINTKKNNNHQTQQQQSIKHTNSQIIGQSYEQSIQYSENFNTLTNQQQLLKTIFQLRQQILLLKQQKYMNKNGTYNSSGQSSFVLDRSLVGVGGFNQQQQYNSKQINPNNLSSLNLNNLSNYCAKDNSYCQYGYCQGQGEEEYKRQDDSMLLDSSREHLGALLLGNGGNNNLPQGNNKKPIIIANSYTKPLIINEDISNQQKQSQSQSNSTSTFKLDMLESVQQQSNTSIDKQNDPNYENVLEKYFSNQKNVKKKSSTHIKSNNKNTQLLLTEKFGKIVKTQSQFISESLLYPIKDQNLNGSQFLKPKKQHTSRSQTLSNYKSDFSIFIQKFFDDFKSFFKTQMQIQLILLSMIRNKKSIKPSIYGSFNKMIEWYGDVKINRATRLESVEKFTYECLKLKSGILDDLKMVV